MVNVVVLDVVSQGKKNRVDDTYGLQYICHNFEKRSIELKQ